MHRMYPQILGICVAIFFFFTSLANGLFSAEEASTLSSKGPVSIAWDPIGRFSFQGDVEKLTIGGYFQIDGRAFFGETPSKSTFLIRRARIFFAGTLYDQFGYMIMPRWDRLENPTLQFVWIETNYPKWAQIRIGLCRRPFSLEAITPNIFLNFVERTMIIRNYCHLDDIGIMVLGKTTEDTFEYGIGFFNGRERQIDNNNNKELVGRVVYSPLRNRKIGRLYIGFSGSAGRYDELLSGRVFRTESDTVFWRWNDSSYDPVEVRSGRIRLGTDFQWFSGPFYASAEFLYTSWGRIHQGSLAKNFYGWGGYCGFSYLLTGETKPRMALLTPRHNFTLCGKYWGAWEIAARYEIFYASKSMIEFGLASGANQLHGPQVAINWYLNTLMLAKLDWQYIFFNRTVDFYDEKMRHESVLTCRVQCCF